MTRMKDDQNEKSHAEGDQGHDEPGVAGGIHEKRDRRGGEGQGAQHARSPSQEPLRPPLAPIGAIVRDNDEPRPAPGLERQEDEPESEGDLQDARRILPEAILADAAHEIPSLRHEDEDPGDAEDECGDDRYALRAVEHVAEAGPRADDADVLVRRLNDAASAELERHGARVVGIAARAVVGEYDKFARFVERARASSADSKGRARPTLDLADQAEPRLARRARLDFKRVKEEVAVAVGAAGDPSIFPSPGCGERPGLPR